MPTLKQFCHLITIERFGNVLRDMLFNIVELHFIVLVRGLENVTYYEARYYFQEQTRREISRYQIA